MKADENARSHEASGVFLFSLRAHGELFTHPPRGIGAKNASMKILLPTLTALVLSAPTFAGDRQIVCDLNYGVQKTDGSYSYVDYTVYPEGGTKAAILARCPCHVSADPNTSCREDCATVEIRTNEVVARGQLAGDFFSLQLGTGEGRLASTYLPRKALKDKELGGANISLQLDGVFYNQEPLKAAQLRCTESKVEN